LTNHTILSVYDFHKINENNNDEDLDNSNTAGDSCTTAANTAIEPQAHRWDFKHPWFNKAGFDRLHKIRRKPPRNRLIPQIRYSSAMEILPSNSPDYEQEPPNTTSSNDRSPNIKQEQQPQLYNQANNNNNNPAVHDAINQLQDTTGNLESKLEFTANEVQYLRKVTESQQEVIVCMFVCIVGIINLCLITQILNDLIASVEYLKNIYSKYLIDISVSIYMHIYIYETDNVYNRYFRQWV
jgi:hypothetical protein